MADKYRVAVVRVVDAEAAVRSAIGLVGGIEQYVRPGANVVIKVNMFVQDTAESGRVTHPAVVLAVARMCRECGANVTIVERSPKYARVFQGYEEIHRLAELVSLNEVEHRHMALPGARSLLCQVPWPSIIDACDVFVNIPGLRTHALTKFSNAMKNLMGLMPDESTRLIHQYGLDGCICDLNYHRPSDLVVTEAIYTLEGNFPSEGSPVRTDMITVADNVVAADLVAAMMLRVDPCDVFYLQEAIRRGMGPGGMDELEFVGDDLEALLADLDIEPAPRYPEPYRGPFHLLIGNVCDSCRQALAGGLLAVSHRPELADMQGVSIVAGHQDEKPQLDADRVLVYGNCAYRYRDLGHYEPGCPPLAYQVAKGLTELRRRTIRPSMCSIAWRDSPIEDVVPIVANAGYVGLETWGPHLDRYVSEHGELSSLAGLLQDAGLAVPMISAYFDLVHDVEGSLETARRYLGCAETLDAPLIRCFTGGGDSDEASIATWRAVVSGLRQLCELGLASEVGFALETHGGHLHDTTETTLRLVRQAGMPNLCVNLDIFNLFARGEDPERALKRLFPWVRILHLKNARREGDGWRPGVSIGEGAMDYVAFLGDLRKSNYGGYVSIEWFGDDPEGAAVTELAYLRRVLGDSLETRR